MRKRGERLARFGPNELISARRLIILQQFLSFFAKPLVIIFVGGEELDRLTPLC